MLARMDDHIRLKGLVQRRLDDFLSGHRAAALEIGEDLVPLLDAAQEFLSSGKRFRAYGVYLGFLSAQRIALAVPSPQRDCIVAAATALELFQAAALIHDDIIDQSDTRRGRTSIHRQFEQHHRANSWSGSAEHFGVSVALLLGDLLHSWADEVFHEAVQGATSVEGGEKARQQFNLMRTEVSYGQYFDTLEEQQTGFADHDTQLERSTRILLYKTAKYSVEAPLLIGAHLGAASDDTLDALSRFGIPAGVAFQLRDDILGVFGDPEVTGKPAGDDLISGKRTVLVTLARDPLPFTQQRVFDDMLGSDVEPEQLEMLQRTIRESGALEKVETLISRNAELAQEAAEGAGFAARKLKELAQQLAFRAT